VREASEGPELVEVWLRPPDFSHSNTFMVLKMWDHFLKGFQEAVVLCGFLRVCRRLPHAYIVDMCTHWSPYCDESDDCQRPLCSKKPKSKKKFSKAGQAFLTFFFGALGHPKNISQNVTKCHKFYGISGLIILVDTTSI
jgi:hypothetical protein